MTIDYSTLIQQSSMGILLLFSLATWAVLLLKAWQQGSAKRQNRNYTQAFWAAQDFDAALRSGPEKSQLARLAQVTTRALSNGQDGHEPTDSWSRQELLERSLHQQIHGERRSLESGMIVLASIGSTAPFIGLFGTVFGLIHALQAISTAKSASIAIVAGPIGEALIATGVGIAVAVPAVLAYNFLGRRVKLMVADLDAFAVDLLNRAQRHAFRLKGERDGVRNLSGVA